MEYKEADKEQPLYHPLAHVIVNEDMIMINGRKYEILANVKDALDIEMLKEKYDPFLDQYDYLVGDISSEHLRLKGFYDEKDRVAIDKKANAIVDYLEEYCNPGSAYFVLRLAQENQIKKVAFGRQNKRKNMSNNRYHSKRPYFKERRVHKTRIGGHKTAVKFQRGKGSHKNKGFVIKKRKG
ncbi:YutD family protein [Lactobacillus gasseri]|uniref:YutD family protein n=1 Tax=Lactobacillus gasseri TaxID=1596 RepID=UPI0022DF997E|nr:YutD family protein [Lactobacillus gasseri]